MNGQLRKKPHLYNEYVKMKCKHPIFMSMPAVILCHFTKRNMRFKKALKAAVERIKNDNTVRPPVDYMGITDIRPDLLSLFVKPEI